MATYLYRLGGWAFEHRWRVVAIWATVLVAVVASAAAFGGKTNDKFLCRAPSRSRPRSCWSRSTRRPPARTRGSCSRRRKVRSLTDAVEQGGG